MAGEIIINGLRQLEARVQRMQAQIQRNKDKAARAAAYMVARAMRKEAPVDREMSKRRGGKSLRRSVRVRKIPGGYRVKPETPLAHLVVKGTKPHEIDAKQAHALYMQIDGGPVFAASAQHPGAKANPFVHRAASLATYGEAKAVAGEVLFHDAPVPEE